MCCFQYWQGLSLPIPAAFGRKPHQTLEQQLSNHRFYGSNRILCAYRHTALAGAGVPVWAGGFVFFRFARNLPNQHRTSYPAHKRVACLLRFLLGRLSPSFSLPQIDLGQAMQTLVGQMSSSFLKTVTDLLSSIPSIVFNGIFIVISSYFICMDFEGIVRFIKDQLSESQPKSGLLPSNGMHSKNCGRLSGRTCCLCLLP